MTDYFFLKALSPKIRSPHIFIRSFTDCFVALKLMFYFPYYDTPDFSKFLRDEWERRPSCV